MKSSMVNTSLLSRKISRDLQERRRLEKIIRKKVIPVAGRKVFEQLSWFMPARWGYALAASTLDMNKIVPYREDALWAHTVGQWLWDLALLMVLGATCLLVCFIGLSRRGRR